MGLVYMGLGGYVLLGVQGMAGFGWQMPADCISPPPIPSQPRAASPTGSRGASQRSVRPRFMGQILPQSAPAFSHGGGGWFGDSNVCTEPLPLLGCSGAGLKLNSHLTSSTTWEWFSNRLVSFLKKWWCPVKFSHGADQNVKYFVRILSAWLIDH